MKMRLLATVASLAVLCGAVVSTVNAAEILTETGEVELYEESGTCGSNVTWTLDNSGTLTISGMGEMYDTWPFFEFVDVEDIVSVVIDEGVTNIGSVFWDCTNLKNIIIPNSVREIEPEAFSGCTSLNSITLPKGILYIGENAFANTGIYNNTKNWQDGVLYIGDYLIKADTDISGHYGIKEGTKLIAETAFCECENLSGVTIPDSVKYIGSNAFADTGIYNDTHNWQNGVLYIGDYLIKADTGISGEYNIKEETKCIADFAFYQCVNLTSVDIPDGITSLGNATFMDCSNLISVDLPENITYMGEYAFYKCICLKDIIMPENIKDFGEYLFGYCSALSEIDIPDGLTYISAYAFYSSGITEISIPSNITRIDPLAFSHCSGLVDITIPNSVTYIGESAFSSCENLKDITLPDSVKYIGDSAFSWCTNLTEITLPDGIIAINRSTFYNCASLSGISIPNSVTFIANQAFYSCHSLTDVYYYGTEAQWNSINIENIDSYQNNALKKATIHFLPPSIDDYTIAPLTINGSEVTVTIKKNADMPGSIVAVSRDENGALLSIDAEKIDIDTGSSGSYTLAVDPSASSVSAFMWKSFASMIPVGRRETEGFVAQQVMSGIDIKYNVAKSTGTKKVIDVYCRGTEVVSAAQLRLTFPVNTVTEAEYTSPYQTTCMINDMNVSEGYLNWLCYGSLDDAYELKDSYLCSIILTVPEGTGGFTSAIDETEYTGIWNEYGYKIVNDIYPSVYIPAAGE